MSWLWGDWLWLWQTTCSFVILELVWSWLEARYYPLHQWYSGPHYHWGIEMRCRVGSWPVGTQDIIIPMTVLSLSRAAVYLPNCAHTVRRVLPSPLSLPPVCIFLNGWLHCSLSFLLYLLLPFTGLRCRAYKGSVGDIPDPWLIIVEWRPKPCHLLSLCLGYASG